jgi:hypothetical protein
VAITYSVDYDRLDLTLLTLIGLARMRGLTEGYCYSSHYLLAIDNKELKSKHTSTSVLVEELKATLATT